MKNDNVNQSVTQWYFCACFLCTLSDILGIVVESDTLMSSWEPIEIDVWFYGHHWEPCHTQISLLKRYNNFKRALQQRRKLFAQSTPNFRKFTVEIYEFGIKHWLTLKINQFIFKKQFEKTSPYPDKIHTFSYVFENYFQVFWKGLICQCTSMKNTRNRNDVRCSFVHHSCKTWLHGA